MARPAHPPRTALGVAVRARRQGVSQRIVVEEAGVGHSTLSSIERGAFRPSYDTARALARWLGWTVEQVMDAADRPAP
jgi:transcriptional regulator with XRE-family HTH domain